MATNSLRSRVVRAYMRKHSAPRTAATPTTPATPVAMDDIAGTGPTVITGAFQTGALLHTAGLLRGITNVVYIGPQVHRRNGRAPHVTWKCLSNGQNVPLTAQDLDAELSRFNPHELTMVLVDDYPAFLGRRKGVEGVDATLIRLLMQVRRTGSSKGLFFTATARYLGEVTDTGHAHVHVSVNAPVGAQEPMVTVRTSGTPVWALLPADAALPTPPDHFLWVAPLRGILDLSFAPNATLSTPSALGGLIDYALEHEWPADTAQVLYPAGDAGAQVWWGEHPRFTTQSSVASLVAEIRRRETLVGPGSWKDLSASELREKQLGRLVLIVEDRRDVPLGAQESLWAEYVYTLRRRAQRLGLTVFSIRAFTDPMECRQLPKPSQVRLGNAMDGPVDVDFNQTPVLWIQGPGGTGKTNLARRVADQARDKTMPWDPALHGDVVVLDPDGPDLSDVLGELRRRFAVTTAHNVDHYEDLPVTVKAADRLAPLLVVVEDYEIVLEAVSLERAERLRAQMQDLIRTGRAVGVYLVITVREGQAPAHAAVVNTKEIISFEAPSALWQGAQMEGGSEFPVPLHPSLDRTRQ